MNKTNDIALSTITASQESSPEGKLMSSIRDPELADLNRHERRKYMALQRKALRELARKLRTGTLK